MEFSQDEIAGMSLSKLAVIAERTAKEHGWWEQEERNTGELLMLVVTELSEAFEEIRNGFDLDEIYAEGLSGEPYEDVWIGEAKPEGFPVEIADVFIRVLDFMKHYGLMDAFNRAMWLKLHFNEGRPYRHGGKTS